VLAGFDGCAVGVALEQPCLVVGACERAYAVTQGVVGVEALDPQHLLLEHVHEALDAAVGLGLVVIYRAAGDAEVIDLGLVVL
jgi:hypothetical protein